MRKLLKRFLATPMKKSQFLGGIVISRMMFMIPEVIILLVMLPMWMLSRIFFSSDRFPDAAQPFIKALPLTPLNDMLRAVMLEGSSLANHLPQMAILAA